MFCKALIIQLPDGTIRLSALVVHGSVLTNEYKKMLEKSGVDEKGTYDTRYNVSTPNDKIHIIVME